MTEDPRTDSTARLRILLALFAAFGVFVIWLALTRSETSQGFGHDSAYLWIVTQNLLEGRGFVNDAHWLVPLHPDSLPMGYHNGGPLFPLLAAGLAWVLPITVMQAGFLTTALSGIALVGAVTWLVHLYAGRWDAALAVGLATATFQPVLFRTLGFGTNGLVLPLAVLTVAFLVSTLRLAPLWGGIALGLAWMARFDIVLVVPGLVILLWMRSGLPAAFRRLAVVGAVALMTISPWLIHTYRVSGSLTRPDGGYAIVQDWHSTTRGISLPEYWHSPEVPEGLGTVLSEDPIGFTKFVMSGLPPALKWTLSEWAYANIPLALGLMFLAGAGVVTLWREHRPELAAIGVIGAIHLGVWSARPDSFEPRYMVLLAIAFAILGSVGFGSIVARLRPLRQGRRWIGALSVVVGLMLLAPNLLMVRQVQSEFEYLVDFRAFSAAVNQVTAGTGPVVVGHHPYFFTMETGQGSLSIPYSDDEYLEDYMEKYGARHVALTHFELDEWKPEWALPGGLPEFLEPVAMTQVPEIPGHLYRRVEGG